MTANPTPKYRRQKIRGKPDRAFVELDGQRHLCLAKTSSTLISQDLRHVALGTYTIKWPIDSDREGQADGRSTDTFGPVSSILEQPSRGGDRKSGLASTIGRAQTFRQTTSPAEPGPTILDSALAIVEGLAVMSARGSTGHGGQMAPRGIQAVLAMAVTIQAIGSAQD